MYNEAFGKQNPESNDPFKKANREEAFRESDRAWNKLKETSNIEEQKRTEEMQNNKELSKVVTTLNNIRKTSNIENALARLDDPDIVAVLGNNSELRRYVENVLNKMAAIDHQDDLEAAKNGLTPRVTEALLRDFGGIREGMQRVSLDLGRRLQEASPFDQPSIAQYQEEVDNVVASVKWLEEELLKVKTNTPKTIV